MRELELCPKCGSGDVGGAGGVVHCYHCRDEVRDRDTPAAVEKWNIRAIFMRHGFIVPAQSEELYKAARALLERERAEHGNEGEHAMQEAAAELPEGYLVKVCLQRGAGWVDLYDPDGEEIGFEVDTTGGMTPRIAIAIEVAIEHANR